jgi:hypothetical protein
VYLPVRRHGCVTEFTGISSRESHHRMEEHKLGNLNRYVAFVVGKKGTRN